MPLPGEITASPSVAARQPIYFGYWLIALAFVAQFVSVGAQNYVIGAFMTPMSDELGWTRAEFTLPRTLGQFIMALVGFVIGAKVDRHGGRRFMLIGNALLVASMWSLGWVNNLWQWIVINGVLLTTGAALIGNLVVNVTLAKWFVEKRGLAIALSSMGVSFAGVAITPVMTHLIDTIGWRETWHVMAVCSAVLIFPVALFMRRTPEDHGLHPDGKSDADVAEGRAERANQDFATSMTRREALRTPSFYLLVLAFGLFGITIGVMLLQTIPFMTDAGFPRTTAALMITVCSLPALVSKPVWGYLIDKLNPKPLAAGSAGLTGLSLLVIVFAVQSKALPLVYLGFFLLGCGWGGMIPLQEVIWASFFGRRYLGAVRSAALPFALILGASAPLLVSYYHDVVGNYDGALLAVGVANLASSVMIWFVPDPKRPPRTDLSAPASERPNGTIRGDHTALDTNETDATVHRR